MNEPVKAAVELLAMREVPPVDDADVARRRVIVVVASSEPGISYDDALVSRTGFSCGAKRDRESIRIAWSRINAAAGAKVDVVVEARTAHGWWDTMIESTGVPSKGYSGQALPDDMPLPFALWLAAGAGNLADPMPPTKGDGDACRVVSVVDTRDED